MYFYKSYPQTIKTVHSVYLLIPSIKELLPLTHADGILLDDLLNMIFSYYYVDLKKKKRYPDSITFLSNHLLLQIGSI